MLVLLLGLCLSRRSRHRSSRNDLDLDLDVEQVLKEAKKEIRSQSVKRQTERLLNRVLEDRGLDDTTLNKLIRVGSIERDVRDLDTELDRLEDWLNQRNGKVWGGGNKPVNPAPLKPKAAPTAAPPKPKPKPKPASKPPKPKAKDSEEEEDEKGE